MGVGGQHNAPAVLPPGKTRSPLYRRLCGPQGRSGRVRKTSPPPGFDPPSRPARSESLYRLRYSGTRTQRCLILNTTCFNSEHFRGIIQVNCSYSPIKHYKAGLCRGDKLCSLLGRNWIFHNHPTFRSLTIQQHIENRSEWKGDIEVPQNLKPTTKLVMALVHDRRLDWRGQWHVAEAETVLPAYPVLQIGEPATCSYLLLRQQLLLLSQTPSPSHMTRYKLHFSLCQHELGRLIKWVPHTPDIRLVLKRTSSWNEWKQMCEFSVTYCITPM